MIIDKEVFDFLKDLTKNNNRDWFTENKPKFRKQELKAKAFLAAVLEELNKTDQIEKGKLLRIYRDVRFSKDKTPYKTAFAFSLSRATAALRGGYFIRVSPGHTMVGGGFYGPNAEDLKRIRQEFEMDDSEMRTILKAKSFKNTFGELQGDALKTAPRGFDPQHKAIDLIRMKQFFVMREFTDKEVQSPEFVKEVMTTFKAIRPFFDYMSSVLTTNANGESIL